MIQQDAVAARAGGRAVQKPSQNRDREGAGARASDHE